ncbi:hypothetical protein ACFQX6_56830 [Streptosporangium lutulentum]
MPTAASVLFYDVPLSVVIAAVGARGADGGEHALPRRAAGCRDRGGFR